MYVMSTFRFPKSLCNEISRSFSKFWWGSNNTKRKMHWVQWEKLCYPKSLGGLNFRDLEGFNQALIAKQVWRLLTNLDSLVARFLKDIYYNNSDILSAGESKNSSYLWKSIIWGCDLLLQGLRYRVGNGNSISMFHDPWILREINFKPICVNMEIAEAKVSNFITRPLQDSEI